MQRRAVLVLLAGAALPARAQSFDHSHAAWDALLQKHVRLSADGETTPPSPRRRRGGEPPTG